MVNIGKLVMLQAYCVIDENKLLTDICINQSLTDGIPEPFCTRQQQNCSVSHSETCRFWRFCFPLHKVFWFFLLAPQCRSGSPFFRLGSPVFPKQTALLCQLLCWDIMSTVLTVALSTRQLGFSPHFSCNCCCPTMLWGWVVLFSCLCCYLSSVCRLMFFFFFP